MEDKEWNPWTMRRRQNQERLYSFKGVMISSIQSYSTLFAFSEDATRGDWPHLGYSLGK